MHLHRHSAQLAAFILLPLSLTSLPVRAENWLTVYRIGDDRYAVDVDSIKTASGLTRYRSGIMGREASVAEMQVDCSTKTRGQLPEPRMSSTYPGTLGGQELATVCKLADSDAQKVPREQLTSLNGDPDANFGLLRQDEIRHFCDGVMGSVGSGNFTGTMSQIREHLSASPKRLKELNESLNSWYVTTLVQFGDAEGDEFVKQDQFSNTLMRLTYLAKYKRGSTRWVFLFYMRPEGWALIDVGSDANLQAVLDR
jgi:hypothetical protein